MTEAHRKIKVLFVIYDLGAGGAERVLLNVMKAIDRRRFEPMLYLFSKQGALVPQVPGDIKLIMLDDASVPNIYGMRYLMIFKRMRVQMRQLRPDVVLSFMWYPNAISLIVKKLLWSRLKVIVSERTSTSIYASRKDNAVRDLVIRFLYPSAELVIAPSRGIADDLVARRLRRDKVRVIHNPVDIDLVRARARESLDHPWFDGSMPVITAIGRLGNEKGFDYLVRTMALLGKSSIECRLVIVGEGAERKNLEALIAELGLGDRVMLAGFQENPYRFLGRSTVFVLSSLYEGFPNVLLEALALGIPSVATRCPTGPDEIVTDGVDGILVPTRNSEAIAAAVDRLLRDEKLRQAFTEAGMKRTEDFRDTNIVRQFETAIEDVYAASGNKNS